MAHLILASSSPRRRELLHQMGLQFDCISPEIDERVRPHESVADYVQRLATEKAHVVAALHPDAVVIAADTSVCIAQQILGKPESKAHAFEMWQQLSGRSHQVYTGVCVVYRDCVKTEVVCTQVDFAVMHPDDMEDYWNSQEPVGKAGAYAIQGLGAQFVRAIHGSYSNVVGLPLFETMQLLKAVKALN